MKIYLPLIIVVSFLLTGCDSKPEAPFGFKWGQTIEQTKKQHLENMRVTDNIKSLAFIHSNSAPKPAQYNGIYTLTFLSKLGLTSIVFSVLVDSSSPYFNEGKDIYDEIAKKLEEKYGKPISVNEKVNRGDEYFYVCLQDENCGKWEREYSYQNMSIKLEVRPALGNHYPGVSKGDVRVRYSYQDEAALAKVNAEAKALKESNSF